MRSLRSSGSVRDVVQPSGRAALSQKQLERVEFFLRLWGLWEGVINIPPPPKPPFDIETFEPIIPPERAIKEWIPDDEPPDLWDQTAECPGDWNRCRNPELRETDLGDGRILVPWFD